MKSRPAVHTQHHLAALVAAALIGVAVGLGCGSDGREDDSPPGTPTATQAAPTAAAAPSEAELIAVAEAVFPLVAGQPGVGLCAYNADQLDACPFTERLMAQLSAERITICRCQNPSDTREITVEPRPGGGVAHVVLYRGSVTSDLVIIEVGGKLLVDDQICNGRPETSIYVSPVGPC